MDFFNRIKKPFVNLDELDNSPVYFDKTKINSKDKYHYAITRTTDGGKYVRGDLLYYKFNGVELYTDINNIIFIDELSSIIFVRENEKNINQQITPQDPEQKQYILLYTDLGFEESDNEFPLRWESAIGRTQAYNNILANLAVIDIDKSVVLVETVAVKDALSVREFVEYLQNSNLVEDDFDINEYSGSEYI